MIKKISQISLVVADYDDAIKFYIEKLGFVLIEDTKLSEEKRWVRIAPQTDSAFSLLLAKLPSPKTGVYLELTY